MCHILETYTQREESVKNEKFVVRPINGTYEDKRNRLLHSRSEEATYTNIFVVPQKLV